MRARLLIPIACDCDCDCRPSSCYRVAFVVKKKLSSGACDYLSVLTAPHEEWCRTFTCGVGRVRRQTGTEGS